jgi:hypothetical protein
MVPVAVQDGPLIAGAALLAFFALTSWSLAERHHGIETGPLFLVNRFQLQAVLLTLGNRTILIVPHNK